MGASIVFNLSLFTLASKLDIKKKGKYGNYGMQCNTITHIGGKPNADLKRSSLSHLAALNSKFGCLKFKVCTFRWLEMNFVCELASKNFV